MTEEIRKKTVWNGTFEDVKFEIQNFGIFGSEDAWTYYIYLPLKQLPEVVRERFWLDPRKSTISDRHIFYDYYDEPLISDIYWHGGVTWYEKRGGFDGHIRSVKIGCNFQHLFDEGHRYNFDYVLGEVKKTIRELHQKADIKKWCGWCGAYFLPRDQQYCDTCTERKANEQ